MQDLQTNKTKIRRTNPQSTIQTQTLKIALKEWIIEIRDSIQLHMVHERNARRKKKLNLYIKETK